ncbi:MAG: hypothetical protein ACO1OG_03320 [Devosia sp.]
MSGIVSAAGWFVTSWQQTRLERQRRAEKVNDFQVALRAEIASDLLGTIVFDRAAMLASATERYRSGSGYTVLVPHWVPNVIFDAMIDEIHVLPGDVIEPVVNYQRLRQIVLRLAEDMRSSSFGQLPGERQLYMLRDYLGTIERLELLAERALVALDNSLGLSKMDADRLIPPSASEAAATDEGPASASGQAASQSVSRASGAPPT